MFTDFLPGYKVSKRKPGIVGHQWKTTSKGTSEGIGERCLLLLAVTSVCLYIWHKQSYLSCCLSCTVYCLAEVYNANCHSLLYGLTLDVKAVLVTFTLTGACSSLKLLLRVWEWAQCHPTDGHKCRHVENLACTDLIPDFSSKQENWGEFLRSLRTKTTSTLNIPRYLPAQL